MQAEARETKWITCVCSCEEKNAGPTHVSYYLNLFLKQSFFVGVSLAAGIRHPHAPSLQDLTRDISEASVILEIRIVPVGGASPYGQRRTLPCSILDEARKQFRLLFGAESFNGPYLGACASWCGVSVITLAAQSRLFVRACQNDAGQVLNTFLACVRGFRGGNSVRNMSLKRETLFPGFVSDPEIGFAR